MLTKKLIQIPSYVNNETDERNIGDFIFSYLKTFSFLKVKKQFIDKEKKRFNVIAETGGVSKILIAAHIDTVEPKQGWSLDQFKGIKKDSKIYGLGAADTKSGVAAILKSLDNINNIIGFTFLFHCGEEYDFQGMQTFIKKTPNSPSWKMVVCIEPTDLKIWNTHKGLIELYIAVQGVTGHASNPKNGRNAIVGLTCGLFDLDKWLSCYKNQTLGISSMNVAYLRGGLNQGTLKNGEVKLGKQGNNIADFAEAIIDIRTTDSSLRAEGVIKYLKTLLTKQGYVISMLSVLHDLGSLETPKDMLYDVELCIKNENINIAYLDPRLRGYSDGQLLSETFKKIPVIYLGPKGRNFHGIDEWVDLPSVKQLSKILSSIIMHYCK